MTESHREHRPLLCDDNSDEEFDVKNYNYQRRNRPSICSGRARNYAKGAAAVITRWPDNCSTSVAYWWLGVSMIALTLFVVYNSVLIFGMIPTADIKIPKYRIFTNEIKPKTQVLPVSSVYMHIIINNSTDVTLNKYLPHARVVSKKYPNFKYKFLVLLNDTLNDFTEFKDEEKNVIAFNSLWVNEKNNKKISTKYNNIIVDYVSLASYLNESPIKKFWRHLPPHLIEFLVRSVSIWEKGGIALNPKILIPNLHNRRYVDKLYDILNMYGNSSTNSAERIVKGKHYADIRYPKRPNNIQDIINELETDDNVPSIDLSVAENNNNDLVLNSENIIKFKRESKRNSKMANNNKSKLFENVTNLSPQNNISNYRNNSEVAKNILPLFLKYLFENKSKQIVDPPSVLHLEISKEQNTSLFDNIKQNESLAVNILKESVERNKNETTTNYKQSNNIQQIPIDNISFSKMNKLENISQLSMDIKGNIIATKTACHAFLGTMFSNVIRHTEEETLTDFIISELSLFCNGLLTSCAGVNVILV